jgi:hypothetical protein
MNKKNFTFASSAMISAKDLLIRSLGDRWIAGAAASAVFRLQGLAGGDSWAAAAAVGGSFSALKTSCFQADFFLTGVSNGLLSPTLVCLGLTFKHYSYLPYA